MRIIEKLRRSLLSFAGILILGSAYGQEAPRVASYEQRMQKAAKEASTAVNHCKNRRVHSELKTHAQFAVCINQAIDIAYQRGGYLYPDLTEALNARRLDIAKRVDKKQITESQGNSEFAEFSAQMAKEETTRNSGRNNLPLSGQ